MVKNRQPKLLGSPFPAAAPINEWAARQHRPTILHRVIHTVAVRQHLERKPLQPDVRETHRGHRPAQFHRATRGNGQRCKPPTTLSNPS